MRKIQTLENDLENPHFVIFVTYRKVASSNTSCLEGHAGSFRLLNEGDF